MSGSFAIVDLVEVSKRFPGVRALDGVSLQLWPGEVHALVGENGAGKSTLIKVLTGAYRPDGGQLKYEGRAVSFANPMAAQAAGISTIYQEVNLVPRMSVAQNLFLGREPRTRFGLIDRARVRKEAAEQLAAYGITADVDRQLDSLGVGARQMVALARAVSAQARVVVMDEPTSSLEPREVQTLFGVIDSLRARGIAVVYVSHRMDELYRICDRVTVLRDGRVVHTGKLAELERVRLIGLMLGHELSEARRHAHAGTSPAIQGGTPVLEARGLTRKLHQRKVLEDVSVTIQPGKVVGLGGLLGSGRSETAKAIAGAMPLDAGDVWVAGAPVRTGSTAAALRAGICLLPEDRKGEGIIPNLSVRENIVLAAMGRLSRFGVVSESRQNAIVETFIRRLRIKVSSPEQRVRELSGGNQQKVLLARWLCLNPKVLLLDEPTRGIDVGAKAEVSGLIDELAQSGLGVLLISSELEELIEGSSEIFVLREGRVVKHLGPGEVTEAHLLAALAVGSPAEEPAHHG
ncbi:MAG TPA: sugar ABC transporter ATP-binding protein [Polyangiaceae bacterium]|nr:sugar ABC transporter ATP-binding protein [Polyangiaceae bacterium]